MWPWTTADFLQFRPRCHSGCSSLAFWRNRDAFTAFNCRLGRFRHRATHSPVCSYAACLPANQFLIRPSAVKWWSHRSVSNMVCFSSCSHVSVSLVHSSASCREHVSVDIICFVSLPVIFNRRWLTRLFAETASTHRCRMTGWHISDQFFFCGVVFLSRRSVSQCDPFFIVLRWLQPSVTRIHWVFIILSRSVHLYLLRPQMHLTTRESTAERLHPDLPEVNLCCAQTAAACGNVRS